MDVEKKPLALAGIAMGGAIIQMILWPKQAFQNPFQDCLISCGGAFIMHPVIAVLFSIAMVAVYGFMKYGMR